MRMAIATAVPMAVEAPMWAGGLAGGKLARRVGGPEMSELEAARTASTTTFFVLIGTGMDLSVLNPFDPANREGLLVAAILLMVIGTTFLAPILLRLGIPAEEMTLEPAAEPGWVRRRPGRFGRQPGPRQRWPGPGGQAVQPAGIVRRPSRITTRPFTYIQRL
jgi:hypothetical protein